MTQPLIHIQDLEFSYSDKPFLKISDWKLQAQDKIFLIGPSGSGKTTFLEIISGILQAQKGHYLFEGVDITQVSALQRDEMRKQSMSLIFQNFNLVPYLNVEENILLPFWLGYKQEKPSDQLKSEISQMLSQMGLSGFEKRKVTELSQGQQQRVAAVRAFIKKPKLLLADEPTSALDTEHRQAFLESLFKMSDQNKTALIFVSHDHSLEKLFHKTCDIRDWRVS